MPSEPQSRQSWRRSGPIAHREGELLPWSPAYMARVLIRGVILGDRRIERRVVARACWRVITAWWRWTTALPGDRFYLVQRDLILEVRGGLPGRREAGYVVGQALAYSTVRALGIQAVLDLCPSEPCREQWWEVDRHA